MASETNNPVRDMMDEYRRVIEAIVSGLDEKPLRATVSLTRQQAIIAQAALTQVCASIAPAAAVFDDASRA